MNAKRSLPFAVRWPKNVCTYICKNHSNNTPGISYCKIISQYVTSHPSTKGSKKYFVLIEREDEFILSLLKLFLKGKDIAQI